jgi:hypothetical protein
MTTHRIAGLVGFRIYSRPTFHPLGEEAAPDYSLRVRTGLWPAIFTHQQYITDQCNRSWRLVAYRSTGLQTDLLNPPPVEPAQAWTIRVGVLSWYRAAFWPLAPLALPRPPRSTESSHRFLWLRAPRRCPALVYLCDSNPGQRLKTACRGAAERARSPTRHGRLHSLPLGDTSAATTRANKGAERYNAYARVKRRPSTGDAASFSAAARSSAARRSGVIAVSSSFSASHSRASAASASSTRTCLPAA